MQWELLVSVITEQQINTKIMVFHRMICSLWSLFRTETLCWLLVCYPLVRPLPRMRVNINSIPADCHKHWKLGPMEIGKTRTVVNFVGLVKFEF
jgi:hypothetical protein